MGKMKKLVEAVTFKKREGFLFDVFLDGKAIGFVYGNSDAGWVASYCYITMPELRLMDSPTFKTRLEAGHWLKDGLEQPPEDIKEATEDRTCDHCGEVVTDSLYDIHGVEFVCLSCYADAINRGAFG
jgi:hypothetical protein